MADPAVATRHPLTRENRLLVDRIAQPIEGIALCDEVAASVERLQAAISRRSWQAVFDETSRLGHRAVTYRAEFHRLAGAIEGEAA